MIIQCARTKRKRKDSDDDSNETDTDVPDVDLFQLQVNTLRRYKKHFKIPTRPGMNKAQLADVSRILSFNKLPISFLSEKFSPINFSIIIIIITQIYEK